MAAEPGDRGPKVTWKEAPSQKAPRVKLVARADVVGLKTPALGDGHEGDAEVLRPGILRPEPERNTQSVRRRKAWSHKKRF